MASVEIKCPVCRGKVGTISGTMDSKGTKVCVNCKRRIAYEFKYRTKSLRAYPE